MDPHFYMRRLGLFFALSGSLWANPAAVWNEAGTGLPAIESIPAKNVGSGTGLSMATQDRLGRLFVGSKQLHVFDGQSWLAVDVPNTLLVQSMALGDDGIIWIGAYNQLGYVTELSLGNFEFHSLLQHLPPETGVLAGILGCARIGQVTYFISRDMLLRWNGRSFEVTRYETSSRLFPVQLDGEWWFQHLETGLYQLTETGPILKVTANLLPNRGSMGLTRDSEGLVVMNDWGYFRPGLPDAPVSPEGLNRRLREMKVSSFAQLPNGSHAIGTLNGGIILYDPQSGHQSEWSVESGLPERTIFSLRPDQAGRLLVTTTHAVFHFPVGGNPSFFGGQNGITGNINSVTEWQGKVWVATEDGVFHQQLTPGKPGAFARVGQLTEHYWFLQSNREDLLLGRHGGMDAFDGRSVRNAYTIRANGAYVITPSSRHPGRVYSSESLGVAVLQRQPDGSYVREPLVDLPSACAWVHEDTTGRLWLGTLTKGAFTFDPATRQLTAVRDPDRGAAFEEAIGLVADRHGITLLSDGRMFRANADGSGLHRVKDAPILKPVAARRIHGTDAIAVVHDLPVPTAGVNQGLGILSFEANHLALWRALHLPAIATIDNIRALTVTEDAGRRTLWVGGNLGLLRYDFDTLQELSSPTPPILRLASLPPSRDASERDLAFAFNGHRVDISLFTGDFFRSQTWQFQTRLGSGNGEWSAPSPRRSFEFSNLSEGHYRFEARAINPEGVTSAPAALAFTILPPWYRSGWAYGSYALTLAAAVFAFIRIRERQIRRRNRELESLVAERTEELVKASAAKDEFLAGVSHEIRNPMNGVIGIAETFKTDGLDAERRRKFGLLRQCASHLSSLLEDILDFSKVQAGMIELESKPFDLPELVESIAAITAPDSEKYGIPVEIAVSPAVPRQLVGDPRRIRQILINFVSNALKFSGRGQVSVTVWCKAAGPVHSEVIFAVSDEGPGISAEEQQRLFTRFERGAAARQGRVPGTGLGLALCKGFAEKMGGRIWLESELGQGSCFYFSATFPVAAAAEEPAADAPVAARNHRSALVVDDEEYNRIVLTDLLESLGFEVRSAGEGGQALALATTNDFDVVFLDYDLPGITGLGVTRRIRRLPGGSAGALILATTAFSTPDKRAECLAAGMNAFLGKPVTMERLRKALAAATADPDEAAAPAQYSAPADRLGNMRLLATKKQVPLADELALFLSELEGEVSELYTAMEQEDAAGAGHFAHMLCGRCGFIYEREIEHVLRRIEAAVAIGQWQEAQVLKSELDSRLADLRLRLASADPVAPPA